MANHAYVKTRRHMTSEQITMLLKSMNERLFKNNLKIEYYNEVGNESAWGPHVWMIEYVSSVDGKEYGSRTMWLNSKTSFEIRHGGGGQFIWWIDSAITNAVATVFNGQRWDDADGVKEKGVPDKYNDFKDYLCSVFSRKPHQPEKELLERWLIQDTMNFFVPPEFKFETGKEVKIVKLPEGYKYIEA